MLNALESHLFDGWLQDIMTNADPEDYGGETWTVLTIKALIEEQIKYERSEDGQADENCVEFIRELDELEATGLTVDYEKVFKQLVATGEISEDE